MLEVTVAVVQRLRAMSYERIRLSYMRGREVGWDNELDNACRPLSAVFACYGAIVRSPLSLLRRALARGAEVTPNESQ